MKLSIVATLYRSAAYIEEFCRRAHVRGEVGQGHGPGPGDGQGDVGAGHGQKLADVIKIRRVKPGHNGAQDKGRCKADHNAEAPQGQPADQGAVEAPVGVDKGQGAQAAGQAVDAVVAADDRGQANQDPGPEMARAGRVGHFGEIGRAHV